MFAIANESHIDEVSNDNQIMNFSPIDISKARILTMVDIRSKTIDAIERVVRNSLYKNLRSRKIWIQMKIGMFRLNGDPREEGIREVDLLIVHLEVVVAQEEDHRLGINRKKVSLRSLRVLKG